MTGLPQSRPPRNSRILQPARRMILFSKEPVFRSDGPGGGTMPAWNRFAVRASALNRTARISRKSTQTKKTLVFCQEGRFIRGGIGRTRNFCHAILRPGPFRAVGESRSGRRFLPPNSFLVNEAVNHGAIRRVGCSPRMHRQRDRRGVC